MPKQPPKNGYFYFMQDFRRREEQAGRHFRGGMAEVADAASNEWKSLSQKERDDYNAYAKENRHLEERKDVPKRLEKKYNSQGISFAQIEREEAEKKRKQEAIEKFVSDFIKDKNIGWCILIPSKLFIFRDIISENLCVADNLKNDPIYLIHVNKFCRTEDKDDPIYYAAELAICKFSVLEGIIDTYHTFLNPGNLCSIQINLFFALLLWF